MYNRIQTKTLKICRKQDLTSRTFQTGLFNRIILRTETIQQITTNIMIVKIIAATARNLHVHSKTDACKKHIQMHNNHSALKIRKFNIRYPNHIASFRKV